MGSELRQKDFGFGLNKKDVSVRAITAPSSHVGMSLLHTSIPAPLLPSSEVKRHDPPFLILNIYIEQ